MGQGVNLTPFSKLDWPGHAYFTAASEEQSRRFLELTRATLDTFYGLRDVGLYFRRIHAFSSRTIHGADDVEVVLAGLYRRIDVGVG